MLSLFQESCKMFLVNDFLEHSARHFPDRVALVCAGERLTYAQIDAMADRLANAFLDRGLGRGDRVLLHLPNTVELVVGIFATLKAGGVFVVVNASVKPVKLVYLLNDCAAAALLTRACHAHAVAAALQQAPSLKFAVLAGQGANRSLSEFDPVLGYAAIQSRYPANCPPRTCIDRDLACLIYTSASTGKARAVMSAHSNVVFAATSIITYLENTPDDVIINPLPLSFDYGLYQLLMTFKFGGTLVLERSFAYPAQFLRRMETERVTGLPGVPTLFSMLLQLDLSKYDLCRLRYITNTAAALSPAQITEIRDAFPWATFYSMYGLTETKRTLYLPPDQLDTRPGSVGIPIPGTEVWIEDELGKHLGPHQVGELVIRGSHVMRGYWGAPEAKAERFRPGPIPGEWICYSGDLFRMDEQGYFYFVSRKDDIIKSRGQRVAPREIEDLLCSLPSVVEAAVVGVPDPILGEAIKAVVVRRDSLLTAQDVLRHCRSCLEGFMVPQIIEFRDRLPMTVTGKINKRELI